MTLLSSLFMFTVAEPYVNPGIMRKKEKTFENNLKALELSLEDVMVSFDGFSRVICIDNCPPQAY